MTNEDQLKTSPGTQVEIFRNNLQGQEGKKLCWKMKKFSQKIYRIYFKGRKDCERKKKVKLKNANEWLKIYETRNYRMQIN